MISTSMLSREQVEQLDLFEFMSHVMGYTIMHPGALSATDRLAQMVHVGPETSVLDVGSGKGIPALHLARKYGCKVVGVDISDRFVDQANDAARRAGVKAAFRVGDALDLPFADGEFDVVLAQAVLIMLGSRAAQEGAVEEMVRVTRPGGYIGGIELGWKREPPSELIRTATARMCKNCVPNMRTIEGWGNLFISKGVREL
ncbi:MAG: class I SAM-dependent methyltransferase, partial [Chloroflexi bacterium]|nr:class I SAM-dependent methyltransferase [Chloroflexota bacterium]